MFWHFDPTQGPRMRVWKNLCLQSSLCSYCSISFILICNMTNFRRKNVLSFWPHPLAVEGVSTGKLYAIMFLNATIPLYYICNMTPFRQKWFGILIPCPRGRECVNGQNMCFALCKLCQKGSLLSKNRANDLQIQTWPVCYDASHFF